MMVAAPSRVTALATDENITDAARRPVEETCIELVTVPFRAGGAG